MQTRVLALLGLFLLSLAGSLLPTVNLTAADIYEWKDAKKERVYSDRPAPDAARVNIPSRPTNTEAVAKQSEANREQREKIEKAEEQQSGDTAAAKSVEQDVAKVAAERCEKAQKDYKTAIESQRLYRLDKDNKRVYLTDAELSQARINARKMLDDSCKNKQP